MLRKTFPLPLLWLLRRVSRRLIFDLDDAIFCNPDGSFSATRMKRFAAIAKASDHIFAGNRFLARKSAMFNARVSVIPTSLDVEKYHVAAKKPEDHLDLVWIGSKSTRKYLVDVLPALELAAQRVPNLRLKIIADFDLPQAAIPTLAVPWDAATEATELASSHIGIAPMRDDDWSRGKCALKVLQYMAAGLPVVSSNAGVNAEAVTRTKPATWSRCRRNGHRRSGHWRQTRICDSPWGLMDANRLSKTMTWRPYLIASKRSWRGIEQPFSGSISLDAE